MPGTESERLHPYESSTLTARPHQYLTQLLGPYSGLTKIDLEGPAFPIDVLRYREVEGVSRIGYLRYADDL